MANETLTKLRNIFRLGILEQPGYQLADRIKMAINTQKDIDDLPTKEQEKDT